MRSGFHSAVWRATPVHGTLAIDRDEATIDALNSPVAAVE
jgi:hypothetical protein